MGHVGVEEAFPRKEPTMPTVCIDPAIPRTSTRHTTSRTTPSRWPRIIDRLASVLAAVLLPAALAPGQCVDPVQTAQLTREAPRTETENLGGAMAISGRTLIVGAAGA